MAFVAFLDTCVLYKATLRDVLLSLAEKDVYQVRWSPAVLTEMVSNLADRRGIDPERALAGAQYVRAMMEQAFPDATVDQTAYDPLIAAMTNHHKDRHVLAAAIIGRADVIVTSNVRHFPTASCQPYSIDVQDPDTFLQHQFGLNPELITVVLEDLASKRTKPPLTDLSGTLDALQSEHPNFVAMARAYLQVRQDA